MIFGSREEAQEMANQCQDAKVIECWYALRGFGSPHRTVFKT